MENYLLSLLVSTLHGWAIARKVWRMSREGGNWVRRAGVWVKAGWVSR